MNMCLYVNKCLLIIRLVILIAAMSFSRHTSFSILFKIKDFYKIKDVSKENLFAFKTQKCDYLSRLFVPVAQSITLEFKRLTYEALTSAVSQGAGTKPRIARLVVQIPEETERTGRRGGACIGGDEMRRTDRDGGGVPRGRARIAKPGCVSVILIRKYNDRRLAEGPRMG